MRDLGTVRTSTNSLTPLSLSMATSSLNGLVECPMVYSIGDMLATGRDINTAYTFDVNESCQSVV